MNSTDRLFVPAHRQVRHTLEPGERSSTSLAVDSDGLLNLVVRERHDESDGVVSLTLVAPDGDELPPWTPGAHVDVHLPSGLVRQYSLCSDPLAPATWRIGVLRVADGRGGSKEVHETLVEGSAVRVSPPRNNFTFKPAKRYIFLAGGIGVTPLLSMLAAARGSGSEWEFVYGGRSRSSMAFLDELSEGPVRIVPEDTDGRVDLGALFGTPRPDTLVYCCGPEPMLRAVESAMADWPEGSLQLERFAPKEQPAGTNRPFTVRFSLSDLEATIPADRSILQVAEELGLPVEFSCREGTCGTCETYVLSGRVDHRDSILTESERAENETIFICVSRAQNGDDLELEI